ncbi:MAG: MBOAT family protein [Paludibacteraceae bacterium]|nr:MBOAT family protein [Paludibacteraceae bacterium]
MLFNSIEFAFFLPLVFLIYWAIGYAHISDTLKLRLQNAFVVIASYVFYGWWNWRFLLLIAFTSFCSWGSGLLIGKASSPHKAKAWMVTNIVLNLGILALFKYYDFFVSEFGQLFGISTDSLLLKIILPVGISFYTFQALSYSIDVYRKKIEPTRDIIAFFAFISFFPQLVAGPIERATNLLPQFLTNRRFSYDQATDGMRQILWGLFKKIVVADNCATYVDQVWATYPTQTGSTLLLAAILFTFQIYGDFSGYSDIAIGTAKLFGIKLMRNFNNPYFSRDIAEFWRRWHISLTTWFRDYVYIPLGGSRVPKGKIVRNTFVIFLLSGFWHGANWTFIAWGTYHALLFLPLILLGKNRKYTNQVASYTDSNGNEHLRLLPTLKESLQILFTFALVVLGWIIFRAQSIAEAWNYIVQGFSLSIFSMPMVIGGLKRTLFFTSILMLVEWLNRSKEHSLEIRQIPTIIRYTLYYILILCILEFGGSSQSFIYFQF